MVAAVFRAPDGTEFKDRSEFRKYIFLTQYTFRDRYVFVSQVAAMQED